MTDKTEKYYTPEISEFHPGFRFEVYIEPPAGYGWREEVFPGIIRDIPTIEHCIKNNLIRVKRLDHEDIVECGWALVSKDQYGIADYRLFVDYFDSTKFSIVKGSPDNNIRLFEGTLRNISDLQRIMKHVGIIK